MIKLNGDHLVSLVIARVSGQSWQTNRFWMCLSVVRLSNLQS